MRARLKLSGLLIVILCCTGCHALHKQQQPVPLVSQPADVPRELCKATVPEYIVEPPDILTIDALRLLPKAALCSATTRHASGPDCRQQRRTDLPGFSCD